MPGMKRAGSVVLFAALVACGTKEAPPADSTAAAAPAAAAPAAPTVADFAGTWQLTTTLEGAAPVAGTLVGSPDGATWKLSLQGRPDIAVTASMSGDSLVTETAEYESILRKGVMVSVRTASVMTNGALAGNVVATYKTAGGTETVKGTSSGTRAP